MNDNRKHSIVVDKAGVQQNCNVLNVRWVSIELILDIHGLQMVYASDLSDSLTFPSRGWHLLAYLYVILKYLIDIQYDTF